MRDESKGAGALVSAVVALIFLLLVGAAGSYLFVTRQQRFAAEATARARDAEEEAKRQVRAARNEAASAVEAARAPAEGEAPAAVEPAETAESAESEDAVRAAVEAVMTESEEEWNRGDVEAFVGHYWKSDDVTFSGGGKTTRGWEATARRYRERYPTREAMGKLSFAKLEITPLGGAAALVLGEWQLDRVGDPVGGNFTLVMRKIDGRWVIVHDHTSRVED